ncbi:transporter substrate-binding domain-containing protein [Pseudomonas sp. CrR25]|nr:transporter substrate-binding domain-containing protein [Pseudomonas sp. CrR25]
MRVVLGFLLLVLCPLSALPVFAAQEVKVGAYHFPPYAVRPESGEPGGLLPELLAALNSSQGDYRFVLVPTSVTRRYRDFESGRFDLILFESPDWGWQDTVHRTLDMQIEDAEVYVARAEPGRDERYFDQLKGKRMALYSGYHYGFAGFNADKRFLNQEFGAVLTYSHDSNLIMVLRGRADIAVITRSYLRIYQDRYPERSSALLVSQRVDQVYRHHALFRPQAPVTPEALAELLRGLHDQGQLKRLLDGYHVSSRMTR